MVEIMSAKTARGAPEIKEMHLTKYQMNKQNPVLKENGVIIYESVKLT